MKNYIAIILAVALLALPPAAYAGFWSTFFGNLASDSVSGKGQTSASQDPLLKEKKVQGAMAMMGHYTGSADGDLNSLDSRLAIKKLQANSGKQQTGILTEVEIQQLLYLSNLYISLKQADQTVEKRLVIYDEIDTTIDSMTEHPLWDQLQSYFNSNSDQKIRIMVESALGEEADILINNTNVGSTAFGYYTTHLAEGSYQIKVHKATADGEWEYQGENSIEVQANDSPTFLLIETKKLPSAKRSARIAKRLARIAKHAEKYVENDDGTVLDKLTGLQWKKCVEGWSGDDCSFVSYASENGYKADDYASKSNFAGYTDWRIPTLNELNTLVYCSSNNRRPIEHNENYFIDDFHRKDGKCESNYESPTINPQVFPNQKSAGIWASKSNARPRWRYAINFNDGSVDMLVNASAIALRIRLVRGKFNQPPAD